MNAWQICAGSLAGVVAAHFAAYAAVFLVLALQLDRPRGGLALPQWLLLLPVAVLGAIGSAGLQEKLARGTRLSRAHDNP